MCVSSISFNGCFHSLIERSQNICILKCCFHLPMFNNKSYIKISNNKGNPPGTHNRYYNICLTVLHYLTVSVKSYLMRMQVCVYLSIPMAS